MQAHSEAPAQLVEQYHAALQSLIFEGQAFWTRITAFVLLNSALLVARSALPVGPEDRRIRLSIAILGAIATLLWAHSGIRTHYIQVYWRAVLRDLETRLGIGTSGPFTGQWIWLTKGETTLPGGRVLRLPWFARGNVDDSTTTVLTIVFLAIWVVALIKLT